MNRQVEPASLKQQMAELLSVHDIPLHEEGEWVIPYGELPAMRATWFAGDKSGRLDVEVLLPDNRVIDECFAGMGGQQEGIKDALHNFSVSSLPVFLAAFWKINDPDLVTTQEWIVGGKPYTAYIGNFGTRGSVEANVSIPEGLLNVIKTAVMNENPASGIQWYRCFFCNIAEEFSFEALSSNEPWESGVAALKNLPWEQSPGYYSVRNFLVLREKI